MSEAEICGHGRETPMSDGPKIIRVTPGWVRDQREEAAHGGVVSRDSNLVTMGDGQRWWLNGTAWARAEADSAIRQGW